jgi:hypothetical protein
MIAEALNAELYARWLAHIEVDETKDAFSFIVGRAASTTGYACHPQLKGAVRDFRFINEKNEQPFAFIPNKSWLLFYFRQPAVRSGLYSFGELQAAFDSANENGSGEWTVKLRSISDVRRLWGILKLS